MEGLPPVALDTILDFLDEVSLARVGAVSFQLYAATNSDRLWRRHCMKNGWARRCPGGAEDLALKRSVGGSNVSGTSPMFSLDNLERGDERKPEVGLPHMCRWKLAFFRAVHLEANWRLGRYSVVAMMRGHLQKIAHLNDTACNDHLVVSASSDGSACVWNLRPSKDFPEPYCLMRRLETGVSVSAVALSSHCLFLGYANGFVRAYALTDFSLLQGIDLAESIRLLRVSDDGAVLVIVCEHNSHIGFASIQLVDVTSFEVISVFNAHVDDITCAQLDGNFLATASWDQSIALWSLSPPDNVVKQEAHSDGVLALKFSRAMARAVSGGADGCVSAWALTGGLDENFALERLWSDADDAIEVYCVDFNTEVVVSGGSDSTVRVWDWAGQPLHALQGHHGNVRHLVLGPDDRLVSAGDVKMLFVWDYRRGEKLALLNRNPSVIKSIWVSETLLIISSAGSPAEVIVLSFW